MREPLFLPEILDSLIKLGPFSRCLRFVIVLFPFDDLAHNDRSTLAFVSLKGRFVERYVYFYLSVLYIMAILIMYNNNGIIHNA